jgi:hypothetical protein
MRAREAKRTWTAQRPGVQDAGVMRARKCLADTWCISKSKLCHFTLHVHQRSWPQDDTSADPKRRTCAEAPDIKEDANVARTAIEAIAVRPGSALERRIAHWLHTRALQLVRIYRHDLRKDSRHEQRTLETFGTKQTAPDALRKTWVLHEAALKWRCAAAGRHR